MTFGTIIAVVAIVSCLVGVPWIAYHIGKKVGHLLIFYTFLRWTSSITAFIVSTLFLFVLSTSLIEISFATSGTSTLAIDIVVNVIIAPLLGFSSLIGIGFLIHTLLKSAPQKIEGATKPKKPLLKTLLILFALLFLPYLFWQTILNISSHNKKFAEFMVMQHLKHSCDGKEKKEGCDELLPIPKILQNKKIVFASSTLVEFDPYESQHRETASLDLVGLISASRYKPQEVLYVQPQDQRSGYLQEREFFIVRAVRSYACNWCIDSDDYEYLVLQDTTGNRFYGFLHYYATGKEEGTWDESVPFDGLGEAWFLEPIK